MGGSSKQPPAPDPAATAAAATAQNVKTATTQQQLNMVDQNTPYGTLAYQQTGTWADGTPKFSATTTLSPEEQRNQEQQWKFDNLVNQLGIDQTQRLSGHLDKPIQLGNEATEARLMELGRARLDPTFDQRWQSIEAALANKGITENSEAYARERERFAQERNDAYNQLLLTGRGQANQELLAERNQPINEITALMSGGQVTQPNFIGTPTATVAPVDYAGLVNNNYLGQVSAYNADQAKRGALYGALGGMAGTALGGWASGGFKGFK